MEKKRIYKYSLASLLLLLLSGCDKPEPAVQDNPELAHYLQRITGDLVFIPGGTFWMGDFCSRTHGEGARCSSEKDTKPVHEVTLSSYSIGRFKVTHEDYAFYLKMAGLPAQQFDNKWLNKMLADMTHFKNSPAVVSWTEADNYCRWLKKETGLPFSLPTEAQWEYAARDRGQYILVATDDGDWREDEKTGRGENYATSEDRQATEEATGVESSFVRYAVDRYPPTPGGLYGMAENGYEWVSDWYDPDYYATSPRQDPQGPEKGVILDDDNGQYMKVRRGGYRPSPGFDVGLTFFRGYAIKDKPYPDGTTVRCAVNAAEAVK